MSLFRHGRFARSALSTIAMLGLLLGALSWYSPQPARAQTASLLINNHICQDPVASLDMFDLAAACQGVGSNWSFVVTHTGGQYQQSVDTDGSGLASFGSMPAGVYRIEGAWTPDYEGTVVYCKVEDGLGNEVLPFFHRPTDLAGNYWFTELEIAQDGYMAYCDWFQYTPAAQDTGDVLINKIDCPVGFDANNASLFDLAANCHDQDVYNFTLVDAVGGNYAGSTPGSGLNTVGWNGVASGPMLITEDVPGDFGEPRVFCKNMKLTGEEDPEEEVIVNNGAINPTLKSDFDMLYCDWFNIPGAAGVSIHVNKLLCPDGFLSSDPNELAQNCDEPYDPVTFKLDGASSGNPGTQETGQVAANGVQWTDLDADTWYIQEFLPDGLGEPVVFCKLISSSDGSETQYLQQPLEPTDEGYRIVYAVDAGYTLYCDRYNRTDTPYVGIYVHKYGCPETWEEDWTPQDWLTNCTTVVRDATFTVRHSDGTTYEQSLNGIDAWWELLPPGEYQITEDPPDTWTDSVIYCWHGSYNNEQSRTYEKVDATENSFEWNLAGYEYIDCYWFNLPRPRPVIDPNAPATLTIVKYTCPEEYDPLEINADPEDDCDSLTDDVTFGLIGAQNATVEAETGDDGEGTVTFDDLKAGSYLLHETYPEDVERAFIWSCESTVRVFDYPFSPFARIDATGTIKISLVPGEILECTWFNVPTPPEEEDDATPSDGDIEVTISVFQCPSGTVITSACDPVGEGTGVSLTAVSGDGDPIDLETDDSGVATGSVPADEYEIDADEQVCSAESAAFTDDGTLDLTAEEDAEVSVYLCG
jgi:hypothetical protein